MIFGTFDTVHEGHKDFVRQASELGDVTIVVARNSNVLKFKTKLKNHENERLSQVKKEFPATHVILGNAENPHRIVEELLPDIICLGYDQKSFDEGLREKFQSIEIVRLKPYQPEKYKTSKILS